jgi:hypothetical protein
MAPNLLLISNFAIFGRCRHRSREGPVEIYISPSTPRTATAERPIAFQVPLDKYLRSAIVVQAQ